MINLHLHIVKSVTLAIYPTILYSVMTTNIRESYTRINSVGNYTSSHLPIHLSNHKSYHIVRHHASYNKHGNILLLANTLSRLYITAVISASALLCQIKCQILLLICNHNVNMCLCSRSYDVIAASSVLFYGLNSLWCRFCIIHVFGV